MYINVSKYTDIRSSLCMFRTRQGTYYITGTKRGENHILTICVSWLLKVTVCWWNFFSPVVRTCSPDLKNVFTKISVSGGPCNIHFCFFLWAYYSFSFLNVITARRSLKLATTSFDIPATICSLVFYWVSFVPTFRLLFIFKMVDSDVSIAI